MKTKTKPDTRPVVCPGCQGARIRQRRAVAGKLCPACLRDKVLERQAEAAYWRQVDRWQGRR